MASTPLDDLVTELAARPDQVLVIAGAGVSAASTTNPKATWRGLLYDGIEQCVAQCVSLPANWRSVTEDLISTGRATDLIQAASRVEEELRSNHTGQYSRWLRDTVGVLAVEDNRVIEALLAWNTRVATTNYDSLITSVSERPPVTWAQGGQALEVLRGGQPGILHLHGHYLTPDTIIFGARSYADICTDLTAQSSLRAVLVLGTVVFVGCGAGIDDPNVGGLLKWTFKNLPSAIHSHFHIVRNADKTHFNEQYRGMPLVVVPYGDRYEDLGPFLENVTLQVGSRRPIPPAARLVPRQFDYDAERQALAADVDMASSQRVRRMFELGRVLWQSGGRHRAVADLSETVLQYGPQLPGDEYVRYALEAAEYALDDNFEFYAGQLLERAHPHVASCSAELHSTFVATHVRWLAEQGDTSGLLATIAQVLRTATPADRSRLEAVRDEVLFLEGDLNGMTGERGDL